MPKIILVLAVPAVAFAVTVGISLGTDSSNDDKPAPVPTVAVAVTNRQPLPASAPQQQTAQAAPTDVALADRTECSAIRGTDYRSTSEQDWFKKNCGAGSSNTASASTGASNTGGGATSASTGAQASAAPRQAAVNGAEVPSGQRLVIPAASINADVNVIKMGGFDMPDPKGYFNVLAYDMSGLGGFGSDGTPNGNLVLAGHVDCGRCYNGGSGTAVFWNARNLKPGDTAQVYTADGKVVNYVVTRSSAVGSGFNWDSIIATSAADMTIITCTGTFNSATHEYDQRHYVSFKKA